MFVSMLENTQYAKFLQKRFRDAVDPLVGWSGPCPSTATGMA